VTLPYHDRRRPDGPRPSGRRHAPRSTSPSPTTRGPSCTPTTRGERSASETTSASDRTPSARTTWRSPHRPNRRPETRPRPGWLRCFRGGTATSSSSSTRVTPRRGTGGSSCGPPRSRKAAGDTSPSRTSTSRSASSTGLGWRNRTGNSRSSPPHSPTTCREPLRMVTNYLELPRAQVRRRLRRGGRRVRCVRRRRRRADAGDGRGAPDVLTDRRPGHLVRSGRPRRRGGGRGARPGNADRRGGHRNHRGTAPPTVRGDASQLRQGSRTCWTTPSSTAATSRRGSPSTPSERATSGWSR